MAESDRLNRIRKFYTTIAGSLGIMLSVILACSFPSAAKELDMIPAVSEAESILPEMPGIVVIEEMAGEKQAEMDRATEQASGVVSEEGKDQPSGDAAEEGKDRPSGDISEEGKDQPSGDASEEGTGRPSEETSGQGSATDASADGETGGIENKDNISENELKDYTGINQDAVPDMAVEIIPLEEAVMLTEEIGPDAVVTKPDELYKWGIDCSGTEITGVSDEALLPDKLVLPEGIVSIKSDSFSGCGFSEVVFPDSLKNIGSRAFALCVNLKKITFGNGTEVVNMTAFSGITTIEYVDMSRIADMSMVARLIFSNNNINDVILNAEAMTYVNQIFSGASVKNLNIVYNNQYSSVTVTKEKAAGTIWAYIMAKADDLGIEKSKLRSAVVYFNFNGTTTKVDITEYEQLKYMADKYFTADGFGSKTPGELWEICFDENSAVKATVCGTTEESGEGVLEYSSFIEFYEAICSKDAAVKEYIGSLDELAEVYRRLLEALVDKSSVIANTSGDFLILDEVGDGQKEETSGEEPAETTASSVVTETSIEGTESGTLIGKPEGIAEGTAVNPASSELKTVQTPEELYKWGIICENGAITGVMDASLLPEALILPEGVVSVDGLAGQTGFREIMFPESLETVGLQAFMGCTSLENISFGSRIREIYAGAFINCGNLQSVDLSGAANLEVIGEGVFGTTPENGVVSIQQLWMDSGILENGISDSAFWNAVVIKLN